MENSMENFHESEFFCPCGCGLNIEDIDKIALEDIQTAREIAGVPFIINSSIRCISHNTAEGGSDTSSHLPGYAFDIRCVSSSDRMKMVKALLLTRLNRIGIGKYFLHSDCDPTKPGQLIWVY